jgi:hypothetical protein
MHMRKALVPQGFFLFNQRHINDASLQLSRK